MEIERFIAKIPYLYHLTDARNLEFIFGEKRLYSTTELVNMADMDDGGSFLQTRRPAHEHVRIGRRTVMIRDQRPLNRALDKCLTGGWTREQFIAHLNGRVFTWPNIKRLEIHYGRYAHEKPVIIRMASADVLTLNPHAELSVINSGATRPSGALNGFAAFRGAETFVPLGIFSEAPARVAEVTFPGNCQMPSTIELGSSPLGGWKAQKI